MILVSISDSLMSWSFCLIVCVFRKKWRRHSFSVVITVVAIGVSSVEQSRYVCQKTHEDLQILTPNIDMLWYSYIAPYPMLCCETVFENSRSFYTKHVHCTKSSQLHEYWSTWFRHKTSLPSKVMAVLSSCGQMNHKWWWQSWCPDIWLYFFWKGKLRWWMM